MLAALNGPIVTDYVPAGKPPWLLLALLLGLLALVLPHQYLGPVYGLFGLAFVLYRVGRRYDRYDEQPADHTRDPDRLAA